MIRPFKPVLLALLGLLMASCASTGGQASAIITTNVPQVMLTSGPAATPAPLVAPQAARPDGIVTASMRDLHISGEAWASEGNPQAPITVVEFSDYG